jgi:hypothetical protein
LVVGSTVGQLAGTVFGISALKQCVPSLTFQP